jgi:hypothetical protein
MGKHCNLLMHYFSVLLNCSVQTQILGGLVVETDLVPCLALFFGSFQEGQKLMTQDWLH